VHFSEEYCILKVYIQALFKSRARKYDTVCFHSKLSFVQYSVNNKMAMTVSWTFKIKVILYI